MVNKNGSYCDDIKCKTEKECIEMFDNLKEEMEWLKDLSDDGKFFDGRRYFWRVDEKGKPSKDCY